LRPACDAGALLELIRRIVLGNTWAWPTSPSEPRAGFSRIAGGPIGEFVQMNFDGFPWLAIKSGVVRQLPADVADVYVRPFRPLQRRGIAIFYPRQILAASGYLAEVNAALGRVGERKALIFWGLRDPGFPRPDLERFERAFPDHKTIDCLARTISSSKTRPNKWCREFACLPRERRAETWGIGKASEPYFRRRTQVRNQQASSRER
jgi:hypothetical protein